MARNSRKFDRVNASLPIKVDHGAAGTTRNLSPTGLYFVLDSGLEIKQTITFTLDFDTPTGRLQLNGTAEVVRVEDAHGKTGIGARIVESRLERAAEEAEPGEAAVAKSR
jgi:hypothetical protein